MKLKAILIILVTVIVFCLGYSSQTLYNETVRLKANQSVLLQETRIYKVKDSLSTINIKALSLKVDELEAYRAEDLKLIKELRLKAKNLESLVNTSTKTINSLTAKLRDSIRVDTIHAYIDTLRCFNYTSKWLDAEGCIGDSLITLDVTSRDSLTSIESLVPKKLWFIKLPVRIFGYKTRQLTVVSKNPHTEILGVEYVKIVH